MHLYLWLMNGGINISLVSKDAEVDKLLEMIYISEQETLCDHN